MNNINSDTVKVAIVGAILVSTVAFSGVAYLVAKFDWSNILRFDPKNENFNLSNVSINQVDDDNGDDNSGLIIEDILKVEFLGTQTLFKSKRRPSVVATAPSHSSDLDMNLDYILKSIDSNDDIDDHIDDERPLKEEQQSDLNMSSISNVATYRATSPLNQEVYEDDIDKESNQMQPSNPELKFSLQQNINSSMTSPVNNDMEESNKLNMNDIQQAEQPELSKYDYEYRLNWAEKLLASAIDFTKDSVNTISKDCISKEDAANAFVALGIYGDNYKVYQKVKDARDNNLEPGLDGKEAEIFNSMFRKCISNEESMADSIV